MSGHYRKEKNCLNCGHHVEEHYCTRCGQPNVELKEPFWGFMAHSIGHYFHFDSKFFHTLWPLLTQPGQVTLDYIAGKRARYIHPVSLYIFVSIVYFLIVPHALEEKKQSNPEANISNVRRQTGLKPGDKQELSKEIAEDSDLKILPKSLKTGIEKLLTEAEFANLTIAHEEHYLDSLKKLHAINPSESLSDEIADLNKVLINKKDSTAAAYVKRQESLPKAERDGWFKTQLRKKKISAKGETTKGGWNIEEELEKYKPKQYFLLMPLLALFIMVNFRRNHIYYIDHLVFTIHGMTAYFILSIVAQPIKKYIFGLDSWVSSLIGLAVFLGVVWYLYKALKLFYNRSKGVTIRKMISLMFLYWMALYISEEIISLGVTYLLH